MSEQLSLPEGGRMRSSDGGFNLGGQTQASCSRSAGGEQEVDLSDKGGVTPALQAFLPLNINSSI